MSTIFKEIDSLQQEINKLRPLDQSLLKQIKEYYRIGLTYSSNALEGNTLTETETKIVLEEGITIGGKPLKDHLEVIGLSDSFNFLYDCVKQKQITEEEIKKFHYLFYYRIDEPHAGKYRDMQAFITGSKYALPKPNELNNLMAEFITNLNKEVGKHPVELAAQAHKDFVFIHPFVDGNGRVARLLMNLILLKHGYNIAVIPPILRPNYIQALEKAHTSDVDFVNLIAQCVKEGQKDYLRLFV